VYVHVVDENERSKTRSKHPEQFQNPIHRAPRSARWMPAKTGLPTGSIATDARSGLCSQAARNARSRLPYRGNNSVASEQSEFHCSLDFSVDTYFPPFFSCGRRACEVHGSRPRLPGRRWAGPKAPFSTLTAPYRARFVTTADRRRFFAALFGGASVTISAVMSASARSAHARRIATVRHAASKSTGGATARANTERARWISAR